MKVKCYGHSSFMYTLGDTKVLIDPFYTGNPSSVVKPKDIPDFDVLLVTHWHQDHFADAEELMRLRKPVLVSSYEIAAEIGSKTQGKTEGMNVGGTIKVGKLSITATPAIHSSPIGIAAGFIIRDGKNSTYHAGDTALFSDMTLLPNLYGAIDVACLPIGDRYTMGIREAIEAVKFLRPRYVIPMHYNTFDIIKADAKEFKREVEAKTKTKVSILKPGEEANIS